MLLGFSFPFYWGFHMEGFANLLYRPIQVIASTESTMWPSFITAFLTYAGLIVLIERLWRRKADLTNEWDDRRQTLFFDHESLPPGSRKEKKQDLLNHRKSTADRNEPASKTDTGD